MSRHQIVRRLVQDTLDTLDRMRALSDAREEALRALDSKRGAK